MSSLRAFRIQKSRPVTSSPSSLGSDSASALPTSSQDSTENQNASQGGENPTENVENGSSNGNSHHDDSTDDIIRPPVSCNDLTKFQP